METVKKHKMLVVGLMAAVVLSIVALISMASGGKLVCEKGVIDQAVVAANQEVKACPSNCTKPCCKAENGVKTCPTGCEKVCCTAKTAEGKAKTCPLSIPKSCCGKN